MSPAWPAARVHSSDRRHLADAPISDRPVEVVVLRVRRTGLLKTTLEAIGLALAGRASARLADRLGMGDSLLRLVRALPDPPIGTPQIVGVDDWFNLICALVRAFLRPR